MLDDLYFVKMSRDERDQLESEVKGQSDFYTQLVYGQLQRLNKIKK